MLENTPIGTFITLLNEMMHWFSLHEIPNSFTLVIEIIIGIAIGLIIFRLQSKTDKKMTEVIKEVHSYTGKRKKLENTTKKFYVNKIIENLLYIKHQDQKAIEVMNKFQKDSQPPDWETRFWIDKNVNHIRIIAIPEIQDSLRQLEGVLSYPNTRLEISNYLTVLNGPFEYMADDTNWPKKDFLVSTVTSIVQTHLEEINWYIMLLANEL